VLDYVVNVPQLLNAHHLKDALKLNVLCQNPALLKKIALPLPHALLLKNVLNVMKYVILKYQQ
jgi:hypothetical protein